MAISGSLCRASSEDVSGCQGQCDAAAANARRFRRRSFIAAVETVLLLVSPPRSSRGSVTLSLFSGQSRRSGSDSSTVRTVVNVWAIQRLRLQRLGGTRRRCNHGPRPGLLVLAAVLDTPEWRSRRSLLRSLPDPFVGPSCPLGLAA